MVYSGAWGSRYSTIAFKYASQIVKTLKILIRTKPHAVFVMTPPIVACLPVLVYAKLAGASYSIDAHTAAFVDPPWRHILFIHKYFSRRAATTIVTNEYLQKLVQAWGAHATIVADVRVCFPDPAHVSLDGGSNMALVCSFTRDEPVALFLRAARSLPQIKFYVTGDHADADPSLVKNRPDNVVFTGFLPEAEYVGLLMSSDAVICLTTVDHTMQRGAYESIYLGKPVITSNFEVLRKTFHKGAVFVDNRVEDIVRGIVQMRADLRKYQEEAQQLREEKLRQWETVEAELRRFL